MHLAEVRPAALLNGLLPNIGFTRQLHYTILPLVCCPRYVGVTAQESFFSSTDRS